MQRRLDEQIRELAYPLWNTAGENYGQALDYWLMAEQMVLEMFVASAKVTETAIKEATGEAADPTPTLVASRVQQLAYHMWEAAGQQNGLTLDFWASAERHARAMLVGRAATSVRAAAETLETLSASDHLQAIRERAYFMWENAGRKMGNALDDWLTAEEQFLADLYNRAETPHPAGGDEETIKAAAAADAPPVFDTSPESVNKPAQAPKPKSTRARRSTTKSRKTP